MERAQPAQATVVVITLASCIETRYKRCASPRQLQLINEETNEELTTLNDELSNRNLEMMQLSSDLDNLLTSVQIPIVMVERTLMVRRATPAARNAFNILPTDMGRRITELRRNIDIPDLENILRDATETLNIRERKVRDLEGREYSLRVRLYRTHR